MPGPLVIFGNPGTSESAAWRAIIKLAERAKHTSKAADRETHLDQIVAIAERMGRQVRKGVHVNPGERLRGDTVMSHHVQAVVYVHAKDGGRYVHGFGNVDPNERDLARGVLKLDQLADKTHVEMVGHPDGTVTLQGTRGQPLAALFE